MFCKLQTFYGEFSAHVAEIRNFKFGKSISILKLGGEKEKNVCVFGCEEYKI